MTINKFVKLGAIATLTAGSIAVTASAAAPETADAAKAQTGEHVRSMDAALAQFDTDGDGSISEAEKTAAGERYKRVTEAMARRQDGSQQRAERMAKRDDMRTAKDAVNDAGGEARRDAVAAMNAGEEALKSGELTKEEAKATKKDQKKWWQFWKSDS
jgi:hypothetical protein